MYRLMLALCLMLAGCAPQGIDDEKVYRAASAPIYSNAAFDLGRLDGRWDQVATFGAFECRQGRADFDSTARATAVRYQLCLPGGDVTGEGRIIPTGPGRFSVKGNDGVGQDWWVLWVDESYRTMAIGNPSGTFGFILNRGTALPGDRLNAAREVFDFNGYDTEKLRVFGG